jgi:hypothetical protein
MKGLLGAIVISAVVSPALAQNAPPHDASGQVFFYKKFQDLKWDKTNPEMGSNSPEITILHVNPDTKETELLIRTPKNFHVLRHWHSANETITVLSGTFILAHDGSTDRVALDAGSFGYMPAKMIHEAWTKPDEGATYFITVDGAWDANFVEGPAKATN